MEFFRSKMFKYIINLAFGIGAAVVMIGALSKLTHNDMFGISANSWLYAGLITEAILFAVQGLIPPQPEYYWEKLYPGLDGAGNVEPLAAGGSMVAGTKGSGITAQLDTVLEDANVNTLSIERLGNNLAALSENIEKMNQVADLGSANTKFVHQAEATTNALGEVEGQMQELKHSVAALNKKYSDMLSAMQA